MVAIPDHGVPDVAAVGALISDLLSHAERVKPAGSIEPPLEKSHFDQLNHRVSALFSARTSVAAASGAGDQAKVKQYAIIETAVRGLLAKLIATTPIDSPDFVRVWNLLDLLAILSDDEQCDPALLFWIVEELLDSQTIAGCQIIFDYLESRRERITAKHFKQKQLIVLRSCNELLRRLSRAEDTTFCGRVFIFMFQSFPLGDKSSVNLRGEFHVENVTMYDHQGGRPAGTDPADAADKMDVDEAPRTSLRKPAPAGKRQQGEMLDPKQLYPVFWSLQESFSQPKRLFDAVHFAQFKTGLESTLAVFRHIQQNQQGMRQPKNADETKRASKRKRDDQDKDDMNTGFNPKYLTSPDLFELEISDVSFRRYVLVQALITTEFLLSLSARAKEKHGWLKQQNKSVTYADKVLSEDDVKWANSMKRSIAEYLKHGSEGPYFYRMVETVLSRDKNWVRWKTENCPPIERPAVTPEAFLDAKRAAQKITLNKRLRPTPMGSLSLDFLDDADEDSALEKLKDKSRYTLPELSQFREMIADSDFDIDRATDPKARAEAVERKASKTWRALRIASTCKLAAFDKIDDAEDISAVFRDDESTPGGPDEAEDEMMVDRADLPENRTPVILAGPPGAGKTRLADALMAERRGAFARVVRHTTRAPAEHEVADRHFTFVTSQEFDVMRDGDRFIQHGSLGGHDYATSTAAVNSVVNASKVPIIELSCGAAQYTRDMAFSSRIVFVKPPSGEILRTRLESSGRSDGQVREALEAWSQSEKDAASVDIFDATVVNGDMDTAVAELKNFIYQGQQSPEPQQQVEGVEGVERAEGVEGADGTREPPQNTSPGDGGEG